jgi:hypothetical protein
MLARRLMGKYAPKKARGLRVRHVAVVRGHGQRFGPRNLRGQCVLEDLMAPSDLDDVPEREAFRWTGITRRVTLSV